MNKRLLELRQHRAELQARILNQREQISEFGQRYHGPLVVADRSFAAIRFISHRPLLAGAITALLVARRRGTIGLMRAGWKIWRGYRLLSVFAGKLMSAKDSTQS